MLAARGYFCTSNCFGPFLQRNLNALPDNTPSGVVMDQTQQSYRSRVQILPPLPQAGTIYIVMVRFAHDYLMIPIRRMGDYIVIYAKGV